MKAPCQIQALNCSDVWCYPHEHGTCAPVDTLTDGLLGWWQLTDGVSAIDLANQGAAPVGVLQDLSNGADVAYDPDVTRGGGAFPGAALFHANEGNMLWAEDPPAPGTGYFIHNPFTIGLWVRLDNLTQVNGNILNYSLGSTATQRYKLQQLGGGTTPRFVFTVVGASGSAVITANNAGPIIVGRWYWIELWYELDTFIAGIRVAAERTDADTPLEYAADTKIVPGGILENPGDLRFGSLNGGSQFSFIGALAAVGFWDRALTDCERGRLNNPADYPFTTHAHSMTEHGEFRLTESGEGRAPE